MVQALHRAAACPMWTPETAATGHRIADMLAGYRADARLGGGLTFGNERGDRRPASSTACAVGRAGQRGTELLAGCCANAACRPGSCWPLRWPSGAQPGTPSCISSSTGPPEARCGVALRDRRPRWRWPWAPGAGERIHCSAPEHARIALQGVFMYSLAYLCVYHAERHVPTGLVAVGYSVSPLLMGFGTRLLWRSTLTPRFVLGRRAVRARRDADLRAGVHRGERRWFPRCAVHSSRWVPCWLSAVGRSAGQPATQATTCRSGATIGWGMLYSAVVSGAGWARRQRCKPRAAVRRWRHRRGGCRWPTWPLPGSVIAFACYLHAAATHRSGRSLDRGRDEPPYWL